MEIKLIGALDYRKVKSALMETIKDENDIERLIEEIKKIEIAGRVEKVAAAGRLSRFTGDVFAILGISENKTLSQNIKFANLVTSMGHNSIVDHDYCVFALKNVSAFIEQTIIAERYSSFTIKSRREVDFSTVGYYIPDFHNEEGKLLNNNEEIKEEYQNHMHFLFNEYKKFIDKGLKKEDARFILPYSYHSNIIMGVDAHTLKDMIIKYTKTKYSKIQELREFGEQLLEIARINIPYIVNEIENTEYHDTDAVEEYLNQNIPKGDYKVLETTKLLDYTKDIDKSIVTAAIMRRYQYDKIKAEQVYEMVMKENPNFAKEIINKITFESDGLELSQVNFKFQFPISYSVLTHMTRHRAHDIIVPDFAPLPDLTQYKTVPEIKKICQNEYDNVFSRNIEMVGRFKKEYGVREEDLIHFVLSGNTINCMTDINGKSLQHVISLRDCEKTQWETKAIVRNMKRLISKIEGAENYASILGSTCMTQGICNEGKECCGKVYKLEKCKMLNKMKNKI